MIKGMMILVSYVICMGGRRNACSCLFGKPEEYLGWKGVD
jgi:hypothetical protein